MNEMIKIKDIMSADVVCCGKDTFVYEIVTMMQEAKISSIVIVEGRKPLGIITQRDIVKASLSPEKSLHVSVTQLMSSPVITMPSYVDYRDAYMQMNEEGIHHIAVINEYDEAAKKLSIE